MTATQERTNCHAPSTASMRAAAAWFLNQSRLPDHGMLKVWAVDLGDFLEHLVSALAQFAAKLPPGDVPARVAMVGVGEARRRLDEPDAAGLRGEAERVRRLARSVVALCDHHDALTGARSAWLVTCPWKMASRRFSMSKSARPVTRRFPVAYTPRAGTQVALAADTAHLARRKGASRRPPGQGRNLEHPSRRKSKSSGATGFQDAVF